MAGITGTPIFPHSYALYVSGTTPISLLANTYNNIIQTDGNTIVITLPQSSGMMDSADISFTAAGGEITITAFSGDTIEGSSTFQVQAGSSCSLHLNKLTHTWYIMFNGSSGSSPLPINSQIVFVSITGNDITGNGSFNAPYATTEHAMTTITDALWEKRYVIEVGPGNYTDNITWKAWVYVNGSTA